MKIQFVKSVSDIPYNEWQPIALPEHRGKVSYISDSKGERTLMIILPCGHIATLFGWNVTGIDTDTPSATPSIFCRHSDDPSVKLGNCWHGYLTNGELIG